MLTWTFYTDSEQVVNRGQLSSGGFQLLPKESQNAQASRDIRNELSTLVQDAINTGMSLNREIIDGRNLISQLSLNLQAELAHGKPSFLTPTSAPSLDGSQINTRLDLFEIRLGVLESDRAGDGTGSASAADPMAGQYTAFCSALTVPTLCCQVRWAENRLVWAAGQRWRSE